MIALKCNSTGRLAEIQQPVGEFDALRDTHKPIGVSEYRLTDALPQDLKPSLPTIEELEEELKGMEPAEGEP